MKYEVTDWLAEIKALKQQLAEALRDRDRESESAANWRQLYTTEAQQRRREATLAQQQIETLQAAIRQRQNSFQPKAGDRAFVEAIEQEVEKLQDVEELRSQLKEVLLERDRYLEALKAEQTSHAQTRKSLTTVIADAIDKLSKERSTRQEKPNTTLEPES